MKTFKTSNLKRRRKLGFRQRMQTKHGRDILNARRKKGRKRVSITTPRKGSG